MNTRICGAVTLIALLGSSNAYAQNAGDEAKRNWEAIVTCGSFDQAEARHICMDEVLLGAGVLGSAQAAREEAGRQARPDARATRSPAPSSRESIEPTRSAVIRDLVTRIASLRTVGARRLRVTTAEGSVWEQAEEGSYEAVAKPGDAFTVKRGALGSYRCQIGSGRTYRCLRVD